MKKMAVPSQDAAAALKRKTAVVSICGIAGSNSAEEQLKHTEEQLKHAEEQLKHTEEQLKYAEEVTEACRGSVMCRLCLEYL